MIRQIYVMRAKLGDVSRVQNTRYQTSVKYKSYETSVKYKNYAGTMETLRKYEGRIRGSFSKKGAVEDIDRYGGRKHAAARK